MHMTEPKEPFNRMQNEALPEQEPQTKGCENTGNVVVLQQQPPLFIFPGRVKNQWKQKTQQSSELRKLICTIPAQPGF